LEVKKKNFFGKIKRPSINPKNPKGKGGKEMALILPLSPLAILPSPKKPVCSLLPIGKE